MMHINTHKIQIFSSTLLVFLDKKLQIITTSYLPRLVRVKFINYLAWTPSYAMPVFLIFIVTSRRHSIAFIYLFPLSPFQVRSQTRTSSDQPIATPTLLVAIFHERYFFLTAHNQTPCKQLKFVGWSAQKMWKRRWKKSLYRRKMCSVFIFNGIRVWRSIYTIFQFWSPFVLIFSEEKFVSKWN